MPRQKAKKFNEKQQKVTVVLNGGGVSFHFDPALTVTVAESSELTALYDAAKAALEKLIEAQTI